MSSINSRSKITIQTFIQKKSKQEKITVLTAYDYFIASLMDKAGIDAILVGDSASNVIHGHSTTIPMTMDIMIAHTAAVARGASKPGRVTFNAVNAILNGGRFLKEGNAEAVKLEGGIEMYDTIKRLVEVGIPVMGHIGLTPQSIHKFGGPKVQGKKAKSKAYLLESALALEEAGCFAIVLELLESTIAEEITSKLQTAATIGIGAGNKCDGQVLVSNDMLGLRDENFNPKFLREYANLTPIISRAIEQYIKDVTDSSFPSDKESF